MIAPLPMPRSKRPPEDDLPAGRPARRTPAASRRAYDDLDLDDLPVRRARPEPAARLRPEPPPRDPAPLRTERDADRAYDRAEARHGARQDMRTPPPPPRRVEPVPERAARSPERPYDRASGRTERAVDREDWERPAARGPVDRAPVDRVPLDRVPVDRDPDLRAERRVDRPPPRDPDRVPPRPQREPERPPARPPERARPAERAARPLDDEPPPRRPEPKPERAERPAKPERAARPERPPKPEKAAKGRPAAEETIIPVRAGSKWRPAPSLLKVTGGGRSGDDRRGAPVTDRPGVDSPSYFRDPMALEEWPQAKAVEETVRAFLDRWGGSGAGATTFRKVEVVPGSNERAFAYLLAVEPERKGKGSETTLLARVCVPGENAERPTRFWATKYFDHIGARFREDVAKTPQHSRGIIQVRDVPANEAGKGAVALDYEVLLKGDPYDDIRSDDVAQYKNLLNIMRMFA